MTLRRWLAGSLALAALAAANAGFWYGLGRPVALPDAPAARLQCLSYTPHSTGYPDPRRPHYGAIPAAVIEHDIARLAPLTHCLRVYSAKDPAAAIVAAAARHGLTVILGAWLSSDAEGNRAEIDAALALARQYPASVRLLVIGNEVLLRRELSQQALIALLTEVRATAPVPVAYAEVVEFWQKHPAVADAVDTLLVHFLPYWADPAPSVEDALTLLEHDLASVRAQFPGKHIVIGETGWPSAGPTRQAAVASTVNAARYVRGFIARVQALGIDYNLIEAIDQPWKRSDEGTVGGYWGLLDAHRQAKFGLTGPVSEQPQWRRMAAIAAGLGLLLCLPALRHCRSPWRLPAVLAFGQASGSLLLLQGLHVLDIGQGLAGRLAWGSTLLAGLLAAGVLLDRLARGPASRFTGPAASLAALFGWLRRPWQGYSQALLLALLQCAAAFPVACIGIGLALSPRHRDIPVLLFVLPALLALATRPATAGARREEALLAAVLLGCAPFVTDGPHNREAIAWLLLMLALAWPWRLALRDTLRDGWRSGLRRAG